MLTQESGLQLSPTKREHGDWGPCSCGEVMLITASLVFTWVTALGVHLAPLDSVFPSLIQSARACNQGSVASDGCTQAIPGSPLSGHVGRDMAENPGMPEVSLQ